jgi:curli biogenesis system outer membrane secretion channel CsgG
MPKLSVGALALTVVVAAASPALAQYGMDKKAPAGTPDLPRCDKPLGRAAIREPQTRWWTQYGLSSPEVLIKLFAAKSGCLRIVDRGAGLAMRNQEAELGAGGDLRRGSNIGKGQIAAADFFLVPDLANSNANAGGNNIGAVAGRFLPGRIGAIAGGMRMKREEAQALITLIDARSTEELHVAEGTAQKTDISFALGGGGWGYGGFGGASIGGYANTEIGKVISAAYFNAFLDLVSYMRGGSAPTGEQASQAAGSQAYRVTQAIVMRRSASAKAGQVRAFQVGDMVYPTGQKNGVWWEVEDENSNRGWVSSTTITPR